MRNLFLLLLMALSAIQVRAETVEPPSLRVMSFNIRYGTADDGPHSWPQRAPHVAGTIARFDPDLLGTQECLAFQRDELQAALPGYAVVAVGRDDGAEAGEMCACFFRRERFALRDHGTFWLSDTPDVVGSRGWDAALPRIATWLRLDDRGTGAEILWLNTHFDHLGEVARRESAALLHRWLAANRDEAVLVVTGDFNAPAGAVDDYVHRTLLSGAADAPLLCDAWTSVHGPDEDPTATGTFHGFQDTPSRGRIDWVLCGCETTVLEAGIDRSRAGEVWPSDHFPVTAVLELPVARHAAPVK
jgi:endonuclease/exonuclease/phosphatase family metal-dependent hydrolase